MVRTVKSLLNSIIKIITFLINGKTIDAKEVLQKCKQMSM